MQINWKDENQGGLLEEKDVLIVHSDFYDEVTTIKKMKAEEKRLNNIIDDSQDKLLKITGKINAVKLALNIN